MTIRTTDSTDNMVFKPAESITEFSQTHDFEPGDVIMTGTPSGCALGLIQSDPIGVAGGINTYIYVLANPLPLNSYDPEGMSPVTSEWPKVKGLLSRENGQR